MDRMKWIGSGSLAILLALLFSGDDGRVDAQLGPGAFRRVDNGDPSGGPTLFLSDRTLQQALSHARKLIADEQYTDAVRQLQVVLDHPEDSFYHRGNQERNEFQGIKAEAQRILDELPKAGREAYESQFGPQAQRLLDEAREQGDSEQIAETARRYFRTRAGANAMELLGAHHLDHGRYLAAALCFERLLGGDSVPAAERPQERLKAAFCWLRADEPIRAKQQLDLLRQDAKGNRITVGGRDVKLFTESESPIDWLEKLSGRPANQASVERQWMLFRGNAARSATTSGGTPFLKSQWQFSTTQWKVPSDKDPLTEDDVDVTDQLKGLDQAYQEPGNPLLPGLHPLIVGNVVLFRTYNQLEAVDLTTGRELWRSVDGDPILEQIRQTTPPKLPPNGQPLPISVLLRQRAWEDATFGSMSSNGDAVFCIEDLGFWGPPYQNIVGTHPLAARDYNRLTAYGVRTGKLLWEVGGPEGESELPLAGVYFLGPPLPIGRQLFALVETSGEVQLISLNPQNGRMLWTQPLAQSDVSILLDQHRRRSGLSPTSAEGVLVCPTGAGAVVAVDATLRTLLWAYRYQEANANGDIRNRRVLAMQRMAQQNLAQVIDQDRWQDALPMVVDGRVIITPRDSDEIHCLNLLDGSLLWKRARGQGLYVAGVSQEHVIVVGRRQIEALSLKDGSAVWAPVQVAPPSGRAFLSDDLLHVPLSTAEVATIDLNRGRILARSRARDGRSPGNLICSQGMVVSQRFDSVTGFRQLDGLEDEIDRSLAENPDDPAALALRGEIRLNQGKLHDAYSDLRKSLESRADPETRALLFESLLEGLRTDFAAYRRNLDEIESLVDSPAQRGAYLRLLAAGLQQTGDRSAAFDVYMRLAGDDVGAPPLERLEGGVAVRRDRWVRAQIAELYASASADERGSMDAEINRRLKLAQEAKDPEGLRRFISHFAMHPAANIARKELATLLLKQGLELESEELLMTLLRSADDSLAGWATAQLAMALVETSRPEDAAFACTDLARRFENVECVDDKTGADLLEAWSDNPEFAPVLKPKAGWPEGKVNVTRMDGVRAMNTVLPLTIDGPRGPYYASASITMPNGVSGIMARDGQGHEIWKLNLNNSSVYYHQSLNGVRIHDHLVFVTMGAQVFAIDALGTAADRKPRLLWKEDLAEVAPGANRNIQPMMNNIPIGGGRFKLVALDPFGQPVGSIGAIHADYLCLQRGRQLLALDPITGRTLWQRFDIVPGSEFFGDSQYVFVVGPQSDEAQVLRTSDGADLGTRPLPKVESRLLSTGRRTLTWTRVEDHQELSLIDLWSRKTVWKAEFSPESRVSVVEHSSVAVVEPAGRFVLLRLEDGEKQIDSPVELTGGLAQIEVIPSKEHYLLLTGAVTQLILQNRAVAFGQNNPVINGRAHLFDRKSGRIRWSHPLDHFGFDHTQPVDLPILVFASRMQPIMLAPMAQPTPPAFKVLCLEKRTGKALVDLQENANATGLDVTADASQKRITLNIPGSPKPIAFDLTFTDQPDPKPEAPAPGGPKPGPDDSEESPAPKPKE